MQIREFKQVSKSEFDSYICDYKRSHPFNDIYIHDFLDWKEYYDFALISGKYRLGSQEYIEECHIARNHYDHTNQQWFIPVKTLQEMT